MVFSVQTKQVFVAIAPQLGGFSFGASLGYPCILEQQFKSNESSIQADLDTMSWITSSSAIGGLGAILVPTIMQAKGRKLTFIGCYLLLFIGWMISFAAKDVNIVLLARIVLGLASNSTTIVNLITVSEMLAPKYRTVSMMCLGISQSFGFVGVTSIGTLLHWKTVALIMASPVVVALIMIIFWPESPSWLIYRGEVDEFKKAFIWLRGTDEDARKELQALLIAQRENKERETNTNKWLEIREKIKRRDFYIPSLYMFLILFNFYMSGVACLIVYSKDVMEAATGNEEASMFWYLMINLTFCSGAFISLCSIKYLNTKTIFYISSVINLVLITSALISYLQYSGVIPADSLIFIYLFFCYFVVCHSGLNTVTFAVTIDLMPVKHRGLGGTLFIIITCLLFFITVKSLPYMLIYMKVWGTFSLLSGCGIICNLLIWKYVPETKGRTLQQIEDYYNYGTFDVKRDDDNNVDKLIENKC